MDFDYTDTMLKILGKNKFKEMTNYIKKNNEILTNDKTVDEYCEFIFVIGVSKAFRDCCLSDEIKTKLQELDCIQNIIKAYEEYINEVIRFCVEQHNKHYKNHLYTELDEFVKSYELKI